MLDVEAGGRDVRGRLADINQMLESEYSPDLGPFVDSMVQEAQVEVERMTEACVAEQRYEHLEDISNLASLVHDAEERARIWKQGGAAGGGVGAAHAGDDDERLARELQQREDAEQQRAAARAPAAVAPPPPPRAAEAEQRRAAEEAEEEGRRRQAEAARRRREEEAVEAQRQRDLEEAAARAEQVRLQKQQWAEQHRRQQQAAHGPGSEEAMLEREQQRLQVEQAARERRMGEARQALEAALDPSMSQDRALIEWALEEARRTGLEDVEPDLVQVAKGRLADLDAAQRRQVMGAKLQALTDTPTRSTAALESGIEEARSIGFSGPQLQAAEEALELEHAKQRQAEEARLAEERKRECRSELLEACHGREVDRLQRAIDAARAAGVEEGPIKRAEANLLALQFWCKRPQDVELASFLHAWAAVKADVQEVRRALQEDIDSGASAADLEQSVQAADHLGLQDEPICQRARATLSQRLAAHDQAACALVSGDVADVQAALAANVAAGGPKEDEPHLRRALQRLEEDLRLQRARAEDEERRRQAWRAREPNAVDRYFAGPGAEKKLQNTREVRAPNAVDRFFDANRPVATPMASRELPAPAPAPAPEAAAPPKPREEEEEDDEDDRRWRSTYTSAKTRMERARTWLSHQAGPHAAGSGVVGEHHDDPAHGQAIAQPTPLSIEVPYADPPASCWNPFGLWQPCVAVPQVDSGQHLVQSPTDGRVQRPHHPAHGEALPWPHTPSLTPTPPQTPSPAARLFLGPPTSAPLSPSPAILVGGRPQSARFYEQPNFWRL